jgi:hypothetical protein
MIKAGELQADAYNTDQITMNLTFFFLSIKDPYIKVLEYIDQSVHAGERGDLLIFMSGINEVRK